MVSKVHRRRGENMVVVTILRAGMVLFLRPRVDTYDAYEGLGSLWRKVDDGVRKRCMRSRRV